MLPTSARFFYYELVAFGVISKTTEAGSDGKKGRRSDQDMIDALTDLRKAAIIPWADIVDETRELMEWEGFDSIADAMREKWKTARLNLWEPPSADDPMRIAVLEGRSRTPGFRVSMSDRQHERAGRWLPAHHHRPRARAGGHCALFR